MPEPEPPARARLRRATAWMPRGEPGLVILALLIGAATGLGAIVFRELISGVTWLVTGYEDYAGLGRIPSRHVPGLGVWFLVLAPVAGGLIYGPLVARFAPEARGHGVPEVMLAVARHGGRIRLQVPLVKALASALCIGTGGSVGREGPIVQIGSAVGSLVGQVAGVGERRLRLLVACGAAGGIAATFNAPIAGVFFALEVILRDFETAAFGVVVLSSVVANAVGRAAFGSGSFLHLPAFTLVSPVELVLYAGLGAVAGVVGVAFIRVLYGAEDVADRIWRGPEWARPAVGGALLGGLLLVLPQLYGVGYPVLGQAVGGKLALGLLLALLAGKIVATSLTIAIGGSGGVFAPSLFMGAMLGSAAGHGLHAALPGLTAPSGAYALVAMGAVFAAAARAPITAVIIVFELTSEYAIILPLMVAVVVATSVSAALSDDTIYTLKLRRRGIRVDLPRVPSVLRTVPLAEAMGPPPAPLPADASIATVLRHLDESGHDAVPVIGADGEQAGVVGLLDVEDPEADAEAQVRAGDLARGAPLLLVSDSLEAGIRALTESDESGLPVLDRPGGDVRGWVTHRSILRAYHAQREVLSGREAVRTVASGSEREPAGGR